MTSKIVPDNKDGPRLEPWTPARIDALLRRTSSLRSAGDRIERISREFLGTPYVSSTLERPPGQPETLVVNLNGMDCFTLLDYVEAMRTAVSEAGFRKQLARVRYRQGTVTYETRNHFFLDWLLYNADRVQDVTETLGGSGVRREVIHLNRKNEGSLWVPDLPVRETPVAWVPSSGMTPEVVNRLETGDYIGFRAKEEGLDVTHVGIFVRAGVGSFLRHASSLHGRVMDEGFQEYAGGKPGVIVLRPLDIRSEPS